MKKKVLKALLKTVAVFTSVSILVPSVHSYAAGTSLVNQVDHTDLMFSEFTYSVPDESQLDDIIANLETIVDDTSKSDEVLDCIIAMEDFQNAVAADYELGQLYTSLDCDNEEYDELYKQIDEIATSIDDKIIGKLRCAS